MKWTKILILIVAFVIPLFTFAGCANENNKTPREWCEEEVKYWCEYDYGNDRWYFDIIGTATIPIDVSVETFDSDEYIYGVEAYDITVYYEKGNYSYIQKKSYLAVIFYEGNTKHISKYQILDLDVAEVVDSSISATHF